MPRKKGRHGPDGRKQARTAPESPVMSEDEDLSAPFAENLDLDLEYISGGDDDAGGSSSEVERTYRPSAGPTPKPTPATAAVSSDDDAAAPGAESDSSSDGDMNPVGDIPMRWYDGYDHIGYDRSGARIVPQNRPSKLELAADPHAWRRVYDEKNDRELVLTHAELRAIARMRAGRYPSARDDPARDEFVAWSGPVEQHPLTSGPEPKRRFLPSRHEARAVVKLVRAMREGKVRAPSEIRRERETRGERMYDFDVWEARQPKEVADMTKSERARDLMRIPAPKVALPKHDESYNPPEEYLPTAEEAEAWRKTDPEDRVTSYLPTKYESLRHVPNYDAFIKERFERCLDLYLAVRVKRDVKQARPEDLIPELPSPKDLRPFPSGRSASFGPLPSRARSIDVHASGDWLLSGSDDGVVRVWEVLTGCERYSWRLGRLVPEVDGKVPAVTCVSWAPHAAALVFLATVGNACFIVSAAEALGVSPAESHGLMAGPESMATAEEPNVPDGVSWTEVSVDLSAVADEGDGLEEGLRGGKFDARTGKMVRIDHPRPLRVATWHHKADYLATVGKDGSGGTVAIHRVSGRSTQLPFRKKTAQVQTVRFHATRPFFFVATLHSVRVYNLAAQEAVKTLKPGVRWISSLDVHPSGDHVLLASYDKKLCWFDLDMAGTPYKTIRNHDHAVRAAKYHPRLPLFASAADDGAAHVFHATVYDDLTKNALIVPLKKLAGAHAPTDALGVLDIAWHPRLPWLFTAGADRRIHLYTDTS